MPRPITSETSVPLVLPSLPGVCSHGEREEGWRQEAQRARNHSRDQITALLWPESDEERGKASLRRALAYLRESLHETPHERSGHVPLQPPHVLIEHHTLSFNLASDFEIDTQILQTAFTLARRRSSGDLRTHLAHLQMAASCYRGNFLDGLSLPDTPDFEDWLLLQRESWRRQANTVFDRLSQWQAEGGEFENAH